MAKDFPNLMKKTNLQTKKLSKPQVQKIQRNLTLAHNKLLKANN